MLQEIKAFQALSVHSSPAGCPYWGEASRRHGDFRRKEAPEDGSGTLMAKRSPHTSIAPRKNPAPKGAGFLRFHNPTPIRFLQQSSKIFFPQNFSTGIANHTSYHLMNLSLINYNVEIPLFSLISRQKSRQNPAQETPTATRLKRLSGFFRFSL